MEYNEYRGIRGLVVAEVTEDNGTYTAGTWQKLSGAQSVALASNESNETHYYDNVPAIVVSSEGADEVTLTVSVLIKQGHSWKAELMLTAQACWSRHRKQTRCLHLVSSVRKPTVRRSLTSSIKVGSQAVAKLIIPRMMEQKVPTLNTPLLPFTQPRLSIMASLPRA